MHSEACCARVERRTRADAHDDGAFGQRRELLGDLTGHAARTDDEGPDAAVGDRDDDRVGRGHAHRAVRVHEAHLDAPLAQTAHESRLGDLALRNEHGAVGDRSRPLANQSARGVVGRHEVNGVSRELQGVRGRLADRSNARRGCDGHAVRHEHVDRSGARHDEPAVAPALQGVELTRERRGILGSGEVDEGRDDGGGAQRPQLGRDAVTPFAAARNEHAPSQERLDDGKRARGRALDRHIML